jgi:hypothetical protein
MPNDSAPPHYEPFTAARPRELSSGRRILLAVAAFAAAAVLLVTAADRSIPPENVGPDFIQFWTAATLLVDGRDPYDPALEAVVQRELGWSREEEGLGVYDFLPYYYPPWLGLACSALLPLGYPLATLTWVVLGAEMLIASALLLSSCIRGVSPLLAVAVVATFGFSVKAVAMGQVAPLVLALIALAWWLLERRRDIAAGVVLSLLTIKPQLTLFLLGALVLRMLATRRWTVVASFAASLAGLAIASWAVRPDWVPAMLAATSATPMPTRYFPGLGTTLYAVLAAVGVSGAMLLAASAAVAVAAVAALVREAVRRTTSLDAVFGLGTLVPFFVVPYARPYDFPILLVPALILLGSRLSPMSRGLLVAALTVLTALHIAVITTTSEPAVIGVRRPEFTYFWIPLLIAVAWLTAPRVPDDTPDGPAGVRHIV